MKIPLAFSRCIANLVLHAKPEVTKAAHAGALAGTDPGLLECVAAPFHAQVAASAHTVREHHDADGICQTVSQYFQVPVEVEPFVFHRLELPPEDICRLGVPGKASTMGGAVLGEVVPDRQHRFRITIGPVGLEQYLRFTPDGEDLPLLVDLVRGFVGKSLRWQLELKLQSSSATPATLGGEQQLGWSAWLGEDPDAGESITGMCFEPERDVARFDRKA